MLIAVIYEIGEAVTADEVDTEDLTQKEIDELEEAAAQIRTIGPENRGSLMVFTPCMLIASVLLASMLLYM